MLLDFFFLDFLKIYWNFIGIFTLDTTHCAVDSATSVKTQKLEKVLKNKEINTHENNRA
jgi:hypothetical protein